MVAKCVRWLRRRLKALTVVEWKESGTVNVILEVKQNLNGNLKRRQSKQNTVKIIKFKKWDIIERKNNTKFLSAKSSQYMYNVFKLKVLIDCQDFVVIVLKF